MAVLVVPKQTRELELDINLKAHNFITLTINFYGWLVRVLSSKV